MSAHAYCLCPRGSNSVRGIARGAKANEVLVTIQNDGVVCYSSARQEQVNSWALGSQHFKFTTTAVFASSNSSYHAVVQQNSISSSGTQTLLSWPATSTSGSLEQLAKRRVLTGSVHSLHPIPAQPTLNTQAQEGDSSSVTVVYSDGNVAFNVEDSKGLAARPIGCRVLSATADASTLAVVCTVKGNGSPQLELYDLPGGKPMGTHVIPQPANNAKLASASIRDQQLICLWSGGLLQAFNIVPNAASGIAAFKLQSSRQLLGFASPTDYTSDDQPQQQPFDSTSKPSREPKSGKKRRKPAALVETADLAKSGNGPEPFRPMVVPLGGHTLAAIKEATELPTNGHHILGLEVAITDSLYGCVQSVTPVKLPNRAPAAAAQLHSGPDSRRQEAVQLQSGMGHLALLFNDAVWSISAQAQPATLASLVGALNLRSLDSNPAARAAVQVLGEEECTSSSTPPQLEHARPSWTQSLAQSREASSSGHHSQAPIAVPATVSWQLAASSQQAQLLEQQLTQQLTAGWSDKDSCRRFISDLMETCSESKFHLSSHIVASTAAFLTQKQWWAALEALLRRHALPALAQCPGLVLAMVQAGRFSVLPGILHKAKDLPRGELIPVLQLLLSPATPAMEGHCKHHHHWLRKLAVTAVESAESACLAHIRTEGELTSIDDALQEKVVKAAYAAAAVDQMTAQEVCLHPIVNMTHDSQLLMSSLRQLSPPQALTLAQYLLKLLGKYSGSLNDLLPASLEESKSPLRIPKMQRVLEWLSLLFDAHITSLHRHPASAKVLSQLKGLVQEHISLVQQMSTLRGVTEHMTSNSAVPFANQKAKLLYSVELLDFRIQ
ncbi:hypothetical protein WJX77_005717 [Trebouxia sp. C0004]